MREQLQKSWKSWELRCAIYNILISYHPPSRYQFSQFLIFDVCTILCSTTRNLRDSPTEMSIPCEAGCGRYFQRLQSMNYHLLYARSCKYYMLGKFRAWAEEDEDEDEESDHHQQPEDHPDNHSDDDDEGDYNPMDDPDLHFTLSELDLDRDDSFLLPRYPDRSTTEGVAGPGPQTAAHRLRQTAASYHVLDDNDGDDREITITKDAGKVRRKVSPPTLQFESKDANGDATMQEPNEEPPSRSPFFPFTSELDWKVAQWAIKEDPGQNALDRLLSVPGVRRFEFCTVSKSRLNINPSLGRRKSWPLIS